MSQKTGSSMSYDTSSPRYQRLRARKRRAEEQEWAARSGPVVIIHPSHHDGGGDGLAIPSAPRRG